MFCSFTSLVILLLVAKLLHAQEYDHVRIVELSRGISDLIFPRSTNGCNFAGTIVFAGPFSLEHSDEFFVLGSSQLVGYLLVVDYVNRFRCGIHINGRNYAIQLRTYDDQSSSEYSLAIGEYIANTTDIDFMLGGYSSGLTGPLAGVAHENSRLLLSPGAASTSVFEGRDSVFGTQPPSAKYIVQAVEGLASVGAKTITTVWESASFTRGICSSAPDLAEANGMQVLGAHEVESAPSVDIMQELAEKVAQEDPDVVITCVYDKGCESWMRALRTINWSPKAQVFTVCVGFQEFVRAFETDAGYIMGVAPWDSSLHVEDAVTGWTASDFAGRYLAETADEDVKYQAASASAVVSIAIQAIEGTNNLNDTVLAEYIASNTFRTIYGEISFDENGQSQAPVSLLQYDEAGKVQSVFPREIASGSIQYPMPTWDQRDCARLSVCESEGDACSEAGTCICSQTNYLSVGAGATARCVPEEDMNYIKPGELVLGYVLFAVIAVMSLCSLAWVYMYRNNPLVKVSQPLFLVLLIVGCLVSALSIVPLGIETGYRDSENIQIVDAACMAVPWLWGIGFGISFSAICAKVRRVKKIYDAGMRMKKEPVQAHQVLSIMFIVVLSEIAILTFWQLFSPHQWNREVIVDVDGYAIDSVGQCTSQSGWWFFLALVCFNVMCLFYAIVLCFQTKHLPSEFAESSHIFLAVMFMFQILVLAVPVSAMVQEQTHVFYFTRLCVVFLQNFTVLITIIGPKMIRVYKNDYATEGAVARMVSGRGRDDSGLLHSGIGNFCIESSKLEPESEVVEKIADTLSSETCKHLEDSDDTAPQESGENVLSDSTQSQNANRARGAGPVRMVSFAGDVDDDMQELS